ncbi:hypothetical protein [Microbacterium sp.]|uniref:hypothetical protein n=1 Tax=Microbacterium sp. TaxID=51671 RepID=UPI00391B8C33
MSPSIERLSLSVAGVAYPLAPIERLETLKDAIRQAVRSGGDFVDVTVDSGERLSVFLTAASVVSLATVTVPLDTGRADGEESEPLHPGLAHPFDDQFPYDVI